MCDGLIKSNRRLLELKSKWVTNFTSLPNSSPSRVAMLAQPPPPPTLPRLLLLVLPLLLPSSAHRVAQPRRRIELVHRAHATAEVESAFFSSLEVHQRRDVAPQALPGASPATAEAADGTEAFAVAAATSPSRPDADSFLEMASSSSSSSSSLLPPAKAAPPSRAAVALHNVKNT